jgi:hypothetical protein
MVPPVAPAHERPEDGMIKPIALTFAFAVALAPVSSVAADKGDIGTSSTAATRASNVPVRQALQRIPEVNSRNREDCMKTICARSEGGG